MLSKYGTFQKNSPILLLESESQQDHYFDVFLNNDRLVTWSKSQLVIYKFKTGEKPIIVKLDQFLSSVFADEKYIIVGTFGGLVSVRDTATGNFLWDLNASKDVSVGIFPRISSDATEMVHCIKRYGKWVFVGQQNNSFSVYNVQQSKAKNSVHGYLAEGPVREILLDTEQYAIFLGVEVPSKDANSSRQQAVAWAPKWEDFGSFDTQKKYKQQVQILEEEKRTLQKDFEALTEYAKSLEEEGKVAINQNLRLKKQLEETLKLLEKNGIETPIHNVKTEED